MTGFPGSSVYTCQRVYCIYMTTTETTTETTTDAPAFDTSTTPAQRADRAAHEAYVARVAHEAYLAAHQDD